MVKRIFEKSEWQEIEAAFVRNNVQYYYLRVDNKEEDDNIISLEEIYDHYPTDDDKINLYNSYLNMCKNVAKKNTIDYANSMEIKNYIINNVDGWEDSESRLSIRQSAADKQNKGISEYVLYHGGVGFTMSVDKIEEIMSLVEIYASDCYNITEQHKKTINELSTIDDVENYNYKSNYPGILTFSL